MPRRTFAALLVAALIVLAGCSGAGGGGDGGEAADFAATEAAEQAAGAPAEEAPSEADAGSGDGAPQVRDRRVIRTGRVTLTVDDYERARGNLTRAVEEMDGFVSDSTRRTHEVRGGTYVTGSVTLRVPNERFDAAMDRAESMGTVERTETNSEDVTDRLVDIEARLSNLRSERERLRTLYDRANDTEDVLAVQRRLSETQERIERLEAQQRSLERQVTYSTITVDLNEERPEPGPDAVQQWYDVPLVGAFLESVHGVTVALRALAVLAAYALPYLLVFLGPVALVGGLAVRRYRRRSDGGGTEAADSRDAPADDGETAGVDGGPSGSDDDVADDDTGPAADPDAGDGAPPDDGGDPDGETTD